MTIEQTKTISARKWIFCFLAILLVCVSCYMVICYRSNPEGYFTNVQGQPYYFKDDYARAIKSRYLLEHKDEYDAVIIGGSKCGSVDTDKMTEYTGLRYYNMYLNLGNFHDYLDFTKFLAEDVGVKEIMLVLSNYEVLSYDNSYRGNNYHSPALFTGSWIKEIQEFLSWMIVDPETLMEARERQEKNPVFGDALVDGRRSRTADISRHQIDPEGYRAGVLDQYNERLQILFSGDIEDHSEVMKKNLSALAEIKQICWENDVNLQVVIGPSTMTERYRYETPDFYQYNQDIVSLIGEVWDFSDYNDINMNCDNYFDHLHYDLEVADLMIDTIYGKNSYEGFGQLLTNETAPAYYRNVQKDFDRLKEEFNTTGTVELQDCNDPSFLPWRTEWVSSEAAISTMGQYWNVTDLSAANAGLDVDSSLEG